MLATAPVPFLPNKDLRVWFARPGDRHLLLENLKEQAANVPPELPKGTPTVLTCATRLLQAERPEFAARSSNNVRSSIKTWFPACAPFDDVPRKDPDLALCDADWEFLLNMLAVVTYVDVMGHRRHHTSLMHFKQTREHALESRNATEIGNAKTQLRRLEDILSKAKVQLITVHKRLVAKFEAQLKTRVETFKTMRVHGDAQAAAQRLSGARPMEESYHTMKTVQRLQSDLSKLELKPEKVMKWTDPADGEVKPLYFDEGAWHLTGCLDGCSVHVTADPQVIANRVYLLVCAWTDSQEWHACVSCSVTPRL